MTDKANPDLPYLKAKQFAMDKGFPVITDLPKLMSDFAQQEAEAFDVWKHENKWWWDFGKARYVGTLNGIITIYTTSKLYQLYKEQK